MRKARLFGLYYRSYVAKSCRGGWRSAAPSSSSLQRTLGIDSWWSAFVARRRSDPI